MISPAPAPRVRILPVLSRVRRSDLILAVVAVVGIGAGLAVTVATKLGVAGPVLIAAGIVGAAAIAVSAARGQLGPLLRRQHQQRDRLAAILTLPVQAVEHVDPFRIGVFPSTLAENAQFKSPDAQTGHGSKHLAIPPYVPRTVDEALPRALEESSLPNPRRLVVLRGSPKSRN